MRRLSILFAFLLPTIYCFGQVGEFKVYSNGLMYSDTTMSQLEFIVDSLNLKFRSCDLNKTYYSKYQAKANYVSLKKGSIKEAKKDMENNIPYSEFVNKYSKAVIDKDLVIVKYKYKDYEDEDVVEFSSILTEYRIDIKEHPEIYTKALNGKWVFSYWEKDSYSPESLRGFYFTSEFEKQPLPEVYARMIQYSDCMVDTSTQIFKESAIRTGVRYSTKLPTKMDKFISYVNSETNMPEYDENDEEYWVKYHLWDSLKTPIIDNTLSKQEKFKTLLGEAVSEALEKGSSNDKFEGYVGKYYSRKSELELKRGRIVVGGCSMDDSPRIHAMNIAILSAETINWETFLRAHLDIMNDRFERVSDGSYAWAARQTYIKELEELEINVTDLLLGISLRIENPSQNHYYGSIRRLGRALAETKYSKEIETKMLNIISDNSVDDYNRIIIYYLFLNYNGSIVDKDRKKENVTNLKNAMKELPEYLTKRIK